MSVLGVVQLYGGFGRDAMQGSTKNPAGSGRGSATPVELGEVLFEFSAIGNSVKVCAIDPVTLVEATIFGPVGADEPALRHAAVKKLRYVLAKKRAATGTKGDWRYV